MSGDDTLAALRRRAADLHHLAKAAMVLAWDQRTLMPPLGGPARAEQLGLISQLHHEQLISDETGRLLEEVRGHEAALEPDSDDACLIRRLRRDFEKARVVPSELSAEMSRAASAGLPAWDRARRASDFSVFLPFLRRNVELRREYVACLGEAEEQYDHLLDDYEPGMRTAEVRAVFDELKLGLVPLIAEIAEAAPIDESCLQGTFDVGDQRALEDVVLAAFGFTADSWRLDETVHPFAASISIADIRLTTRHHDDNLHSLFSCMHEFGHGLYERQVAPELEGTPLASGCSLAFHESQSRLWENLVGRSRPFWEHFYPELQRRFPRFSGVGLDEFYRAINAVRPSLIRIEADEATYNLHVILRFELEQEMLAGSLDLADLPEAWDAKMKDYLGIDVPDVADGVLQDMHWAAGSLGYFSTYALGNIISCQLWQRIEAELSDVQGQIGRAEFGPLREWLGEHVHRSGQKFLPRELLQRVVGGGIDSGPYLAYLRAKLGALYGL